MELTPAQIDAQNTSKRRLRVIREEGITFQSRRDDEMAAGRLAGLSLREIGREVGLSQSSVKDHLDKLGIELPEWARREGIE